MARLPRMNNGCATTDELHPRGERSIVLPDTQMVNFDSLLAKTALSTGLINYP